MAVSKIWTVSYNLKAVIDYAENPEKTKNPQYTQEQYQALRDVLAYAKDEEKTEREFYVQGINCNPSTAREQFVTVKEQFDKLNGIQAYHGYLSFKENEVTPELAQQIGMEFANEVWGKRFQVVVTTHLNTKHLHCHFVVNSVSFVDGKKLANEEKAWFKFSKIADRLCKEHGLSVIENPDRNRPPYHITRQTEAGMPTRFSVAKAAVDEAISHSRSLVDFERELQKLGYSYDLSKNKKYWTIKPAWTEKSMRMYRFGDDYTNDRIKERIRANRENVAFHSFQPKAVIIRQYRLPTRENKIRKVSGLYGLYLHYCYKLGYLPKYKKQNPLRVHYLFRDDLMKLDELTAQTTLLGRNHISDTEQLSLYKQSLEGEIKKLTADRTHLRNKIRKVDIDDAELSAAKEKISAISDRLRTLRKEVKLCAGIAERSDDMKRNLDTVLAEEEKQNRKENRTYEYRR